MNCRCFGFILSAFLQQLSLPRLLCGMLLFANLLLCDAAAAQTASKNDPRAIVLGLISEVNQAAIEENFRDFVRYVTRRLAMGPESEAKVIIAPTAFELVKHLEQRRVDFYMESAYPTYTINYVHNAGKTLLRRWKGGVAEYQSLIITKRDSSVKRLADLKGKTMIFEDPGSTSGYLMPKLFLARNGFKLAEKRGFDANASPADITYTFANSRRKLLESVLNKQVAAGAMSDDDFAKLDNASKSDIVVLAQTERLPRHLVSVRADLSQHTVARLHDILIAMHDDPEGQKILKKTDQTTKFDRLPGGEEALRKRLLDSFFSPERSK